VGDHDTLLILLLPTDLSAQRLSERSVYVANGTCYTSELSAGLAGMELQIKQCIELVIKPYPANVEYRVSS
jgi:hypothetical protein